MKGLTVLIVALLTVGTSACDGGGEPGSHRSGSGVSDELAIALKEAATAEEKFATAHGGDYTDDEHALEEAGFVSRPGVTLNIVEAAEYSYCLEAFDSGSVAHFSTEAMVPQVGKC